MSSGFRAPAVTVNPKGPFLIHVGFPALDRIGLGDTFFEGPGTILPLPPGPPSRPLSSSGFFSSLSLGGMFAVIAACQQWRRRSRYCCLITTTMATASTMHLLFAAAAAAVAVVVAVGVSSTVSAAPMTGRSSSGAPDSDKISIPRACAPGFDHFPFCDVKLPLQQRVDNLIDLLHDDEMPPLLTARESPKGNVSRIG